MGCCSWFDENIPGPDSTPTPDPDCSVIVTFPDPNLEEVIREVINKPAGDIYLCEVKTIEYLFGQSRGIGV
jgi:hypothetical protein